MKNNPRIIKLPARIIALNETTILVNPVSESMFDEIAKQGYRRVDDIPQIVDGHPYYKYSKGN